MRCTSPPTSTINKLESDRLGAGGLEFSFLAREIEIAHRPATLGRKGAIGPPDFILPGSLPPRAPNLRSEFAWSGEQEGYWVSGPYRLSQISNGKT